MRAPWVAWWFALAVLQGSSALAASARERLAVDLVVALDAGKSAVALTRLSPQVRSEVVDRTLVDAADGMRAQVGKLRRIRLTWTEGERVKVAVECDRGDWLYSFRFDDTLHVTHFGSGAPFASDPPYGCDRWDEQRFKSGGAQALDMVPATPGPHPTVVIVDPLPGGKGGVDPARDLAVGLACRGVRSIRRLSGGLAAIRAALVLLRQEGEIAGGTLLFVCDVGADKVVDKLALANEPIVLIGKAEASERFRVVEHLFAERLSSATGPEYLLSGHVAEDVVSKIAIWARGER